MRSDFAHHLDRSAQMLLDREIIMTRKKIPSTKFAHKKNSAQQGIVILEALVAVLLFSMGILALVGLQAAMIKNTSDAKYRSEASFIAQQRIGQIWANPPTPTNANSPVESATDISALLPSGTRTVTQPDTNQPTYVITVTWQQPGQPVHNFTTVASIAGN